MLFVIAPFYSLLKSYSLSQCLQCLNAVFLNLPPYSIECIIYLNTFDLQSAVVSGVNHIVPLLIYKIESA